MAWYIDGNALYEQTAEWEARALKHVNELSEKPYDEMTAEELDEWRKWSYILHERSAFKNDVAEAMTADVVERKKGKWVHETYRINGNYNDMLGFYRCSECGHANWIKEDNFCHNCGADMREKETENAVH